MNNKRLPEYQPMELSRAKQLGESYGFKCSIVNETTLEIFTKLNRWICHVHNNCLELRHQNRTRDTKHDHPQRLFYDFYFMFNSIKNHESYEFNKTYRKVERWNNIFDNIHKNKETYYIKLV
jgi:hypothetical protein